MRIAHISDIHTETTSSFQNRFRTLLQSLRDHRVNHLFITGDLTDKATTDEYDVVIRILNEFDFSTGRDVTVIPGNHDLYPSVYQSFTFRLSTLREEFRREPVRVSKELYRVLRAYRTFNPEKYRNALQLFFSRFQFTFDNATAIGGKNTAGFPFIKHLNDDYAAVCIDSNFVSPHLQLPIPFALLTYVLKKDMYSVTDNPICSNGWIDLDLCQRAFDHPSLRKKKTFLLMHHYLYTLEQEKRYMKPSFAKMMSLINRHELIDKLSELDTNLILHGHWHVTEEYPLGDGKSYALNGAGVLKKDDSRWNLLNLTSSGISREAIQF
jgi:3',5'-cyclic-AMP phosphodiesterase